MTRTSPHVVNTRNRPRHFSADAESPATTPSSSRLHRAHHRPPTPTACPCAGTAGLSSLLPYPCALFQGVSRPPGQACTSVLVPEPLQPARLDFDPRLQSPASTDMLWQWLNSSAEEESHSARAAGAGAGQQPEDAAPESIDSTVTRLAHLTVAVSMPRTTMAAISISSTMRDSEQRQWRTDSQANHGTALTRLTLRIVQYGFLVALSAPPQQHRLSSASLGRPSAC